MQSNEGFPDGKDLLTRKVNEYEGQHRFGGGTDSDCDPHVIDILAGNGTGAADEVAAPARDAEVRVQPGRHPQVGRASSRWSTRRSRRPDSRVEERRYDPMRFSRGFAIGLLAATAALASMPGVRRGRPDDDHHR